MAEHKLRFWVWNLLHKTSNRWFNCSLCRFCSSAELFTDETDWMADVWLDYFCSHRQTQWPTILSVVRSLEYSFPHLLSPSLPPLSHTYYLPPSPLLPSLSPFLCLSLPPPSLPLAFPSSILPSLPPSLPPLLSHSLSHSLTKSLTPSLSHSLSHALIKSLIDRFSHWFKRFLHLLSNKNRFKPFWSPYFFLENIYQIGDGNLNFVYIVSGPKGKVERRDGVYSTISRWHYCIPPVYWWNDDVLSVRAVIILNFRILRH